MGTRSRLAAAWGVALVVWLTLARVAGAGSEPNDPGWPFQWDLAQVGASAAWSASQGAEVAIGVVDTGVDLNHPELRGKIDRSASCLGGTCEPGGDDGHGHGTHVSGIAAASTDNGLGVAGVAPEARLVVAQALDSTGQGSSADVSAAIRWVVDNGARVVNLSLGDSDLLSTNAVETDFGRAIEYAWSQGAVPVLASGNWGRDQEVTNRFGDLNAIVVGATTPNGDLAAYSTPTGDAKWGIVAPGGTGDGLEQHGVWSTWRGQGYASVSGTSMATPHVSGTVALLLAAGYSPLEAVSRILDTADPIECGCRGRLNTAAALGVPHPDRTTSTTVSRSSTGRNGLGGLPNTTSSSAPTTTTTEPDVAPSDPPLPPDPEPPPPPEVIDDTGDDGPLETPSAVVDKDGEPVVPEPAPAPSSTTVPEPSTTSRAPATTSSTTTTTVPPAENHAGTGPDAHPVRPGPAAPWARGRQPASDPGVDGDQPVVVAGTLLLGGVSSALLMVLRVRRPGG